MALSSEKEARGIAQQLMCAVSAPAYVGAAGDFTFALGDVTENLDTKLANTVVPIVASPTGDGTYLRLIPQSPLLGPLQLNSHFSLLEKVAPTCVVGFDFIWADSTAHRLEECDNNGSPVTIAHLTDNLGAFAAGGAIAPASVSSTGPISGTSISGTTVSGTTGSFSGIVTAPNIESVLYADQATGADCGAKINAQDVALGANPGQIVVNRACGTTWTTAVSLGTNHSLVFNQSGVFILGASITMGQGSNISGLPNSTVGNPCDNLSGTCLREANASNLPALVIVSGSGATIRNVSLDGNKANNPTGGVGLKTNLSSRTKLENMWIENFPSHGWWILSSGTSNQSAVPKVSSSVFLNNSGDGVYSVGSNDFFAQDANEFESNGVKATVNTSVTGVATFVSGSAWSSDSSLVGTLVQINGIPCQVSAVTLTTFSTANCRSSVNSLTGAIVYWGGGVELSDSGAARIIGSDFGGNFGPGIVMYGVGGGLTSIQNQVIANSFGNNFTQDIMVLADGIGDNQTFTAGEESISGNTFLNKNGAAQANTFDDVFLRDCLNDVVAMNNFSSGSITTRWYVQVTEHTPGVASNENVAVAANSFNPGSLGTGTLNCPNTHGCSGGPMPTCAFTSGGGTGTPTCGVPNGSNNLGGVLGLNTGTTASASGTVTLTFNGGLGTNGVNCNFTPQDGSQAWAGAATMKITTSSTVSVVVAWANAGAALLNTSGYNINYNCSPR
jgi:hypothetical protein